MTGLFLTIEGIDGAGKTSLINSLKDYFESKGRNVVVTAEPCGKIRSILLDSEDMCDKTELLLMEASRSEHVETLIKPALNDGKVVICDRFTDSTVAYQGYARDMDFGIIKALNDYASSGLVPDMTILLDLSEDVGLARQCRVDRISAEGLEFMRKVREGFLKLADANERITVIDAAMSIDEVTKAAICAISKKLEGVL